VNWRRGKQEFVVVKRDRLAFSSSFQNTEEVKRRADLSVESNADGLNECRGRVLERERRGRME
jgi:hypothetical protein